MIGKNPMIDYLKWRGDLTFEQDPFNLVDNLILSQLAYVDYDGIVPGTRGNKVPIGDVSRRYWDLHSVKEIRKRESFVKLSPFLLEPVAQSRRFGKMRLCGYANYLNKSAQAQMSAVQFELEDGTVFVAFRGTDDTLIGWKEDFNLSFMPQTEGQRLAAGYMVFHFSNTDLKLRVGGHSKGGNFAVFASAFSGQKVSEQIKVVYRNDAPGFREEITAMPEYKKIIERTISIIPEDSIVGCILNAGKDALVVRSNQKGILQHDALTWEILGNHFIQTKRSSDSIYLEKVMSRWLENTDDEARRVFVDHVFSILQAIGAERMKDMKGIGLSEFKEALQIASGLSKEQQAGVSEVIKGLVASNGKTLFEEMGQSKKIVPELFKALSELKEKIREAGRTWDESVEQEMLEQETLEKEEKQQLEAEGSRSDDTAGENPK